MCNETQVLSEPGVPERDLKARAKALKKLGSIFQVLRDVFKTLCWTLVTFRCMCSCPGSAGVTMQ